MILPPVVTIIVSKSGAPAAFKVVGVAFLIIICGCSFLMEQCPELAVDVNIRHRPILMQMVDKYVEAHTGYQGMEVTADGVLCKDAEGNEVLVPGKSVICAVGQRANRDGVNALRNCAPVVREIGDCVRPGNITSAIYMGYHAGLDA